MGPWEGLCWTQGRVGGSSGQRPWRRLGVQGWMCGGSHTLQRSPLRLTGRSYGRRDLSVGGQASAQGLTGDRDLGEGDKERHLHVLALCADGVTGLLLSHGE